MTNIRNNWKDLPDKTTPINAERLNNLEQNAGKGADFVDNVSAVGMDLVTAETALAARTFIGAGTSNLAVATTAPANLAASAAVGTETTAARADHVHALPAAVTTSANGLMIAADKTKLDGIAAGTTNPVIAGAAAVGTSTAYARQDHVHPAQTTVSGNAGTATALATGRTFSITGGAVGSGSSTFNGTQNITIDVAITPATNTVVGGVTKAYGVEDTTGEDLVAIKNTINELLANLRDAGIMS